MKLLYEIDKYCLLYGTCAALATQSKTYMKGEGGTHFLLAKDLENQAIENFESLICLGCKALEKDPEETLGLTLNAEGQARVKQLWDIAEEMYHMLASKRMSVFVEKETR